jgi:hypothetical protein
VQETSSKYVGETDDEQHRAEVTVRAPRAAAANASNYWRMLGGGRMSWHEPQRQRDGKSERDKFGLKKGSARLLLIVPHQQVTHRDLQDGADTIERVPADRSPVVGIELADGVAVNPH